MGMANAGLKSQADLARKMKVHRQTVNKWLNGESDELTPEMLFKLSDALNVNARWLALGPPESPVQPRTLDPEQAEVIQIRDALAQASSDARDQWLTSGRSLVRIVTPKSTANPFPAKHKK